MKLDLDRQRNLLFLAFGIFVFSHFAGFFFSQLGYLFVFTVFFYIAYSLLREFRENADLNNKFFGMVEKLANLMDIGVSGTVLASVVLAVLTTVNVI